MLPRAAQKHQPGALGVPSSDKQDYWLQTSHGWQGIVSVGNEGERRAHRKDVESASIGGGLGE